MITDNIGVILIVTGAITAGVLLQYLAPQFFLRASVGETPQDALGMFYARAWGVAVFAYGALLIYAGLQPEGRDAIVAAATVGKAGFVLLILTHWSSQAFARRLAPVIVFDTLCVALYLVYLFGLA